MTDLMDLVEAYKREVSTPGMFATDYPTVTDDDIAALLGDAFAEAQLDGFFRDHELDVDAGVVTPDLSLAGGALLVIYGSIRSTRQRITFTSTQRRYQAGPVSMQEGGSAMVLTEMLRSLERRRADLLRGGGGPSLFVMDAYLTRGIGSYGGFFAGELF